jgi:hypothetical protein
VGRPLTTLNHPSRENTRKRRSFYFVLCPTTDWGLSGDWLVGSLQTCTLQVLKKALSACSWQWQQEEEEAATGGFKT